MKILFHVDDTNRLGMAATNAANAARYVQDNRLELETEIVVNGEAVTGLVRKGIEEPLYQSLQKLSDSHVRIAACQNAMRAHQLTKEDLCDFVDVVPAGIIELAQKQEEGYAYIKP
ncbi:DsrE family protein [Eubacterium sp. 1001713B170207_170306_E7]|uniref:DsrE family protein n=1 Tax=Eubacterium sp. 1001713B170207_170306_E7 TaxID=2787097 RepID=UPI0018996D0B|nr:DsrE family protein [Eubacterium sp. 1001713B170207_170306_E7]